VDPNLAIRDAKGRIESVRYTAIDTMLLNEFLKEHSQVKKEGSIIQEQQATILELKSAINALTATVKQQAAQIQRVSAEIEPNGSASQIVISNR